MIEAALAHDGIDARYINCEVRRPISARPGGGDRATGWLGFNCSIPHKVAVIAHIDSLGQSAATIGAVNCVVRREGQLIGENTDGKGFVESLRTLVDPAGKTLMLFGAGGAARAIAVESALAGATAITVVNRDPARGRGLVGLLNEKTPRAPNMSRGRASTARPSAPTFWSTPPRSACFPMSKAGSRSTWRASPRRMIVADVIPNPPRTLLIRQAEARGCRTLDGLGMLVNQGVISIKHWTGVDVEPAAMRRKLEELFGA